MINHGTALENVNKRWIIWRFQVMPLNSCWPSNPSNPSKSKSVSTILGYIV